MILFLSALFYPYRIGSEDCLPFAVSLIENGDLIAIAEDNGEFGCGSLLGSTLGKLEGHNILICVARKVRDSFVDDMIQGKINCIFVSSGDSCITQNLCLKGQKLNAVKEAAISVLELLRTRLDGFNSDEKKDVRGLNVVSHFKAQHRALSPPRITIGDEEYFVHNKYIYYYRNTNYK